MMILATISGGYFGLEQKKTNRVKGGIGDMGRTEVIVVMTIAMIFTEVLVVGGIEIRKKILVLAVMRVVDQEFGVEGRKQRKMIAAVVAFTTIVQILNIGLCTN